jgi:hypothetical protein
MLSLTSQMTLPVAVKAGNTARSAQASGEPGRCLRMPAMTAHRPARFETT